VAVAVNDMPHGAQHDTSCGAQDPRAPHGRGVSRAGTGSAACLADAAAAAQIVRTCAFAWPWQWRHLPHGVQLDTGCGAQGINPAAAALHRSSGTIRSE
jgi:hypothetical protein